MDKLSEKLGQLLSELHSEKKELLKALKEGKNDKRSWNSAMIGLSSFRALHRQVSILVQQVQKNVLKDKKTMENCHLQLQNLLYEKSYLQAEIQRCRDFQCVELSKIDFVDYEFKKEIDAACHASQLGKLSEELQKRRNAVLQLKEIRVDMQQIEQSTRKKQNFLKGLPNHLDTLEKATKPLQEYMSVSASDRITKHREAKQLPHPLYLVFCELEAYIDAFERHDDLRLNILDSGQPTATMARRGSAVEDEMPQKKRSKTNSTAQELSQDECMQRSKKMLVLEVMAEHGSKKSTLAIQFLYFPKIHVVGVETPKYPGVLTSLFPGDTGQKNPYLSNNYTIQMKDTKEPFEYPADHSARPFSWAQWICGIYNLAPDQQFRPEPSIRTVMTQLSQRFKAHLSLRGQLKKLLKTTPVVDIHEDAKTLFDQEELTTIVSKFQLIPTPPGNPFQYSNDTADDAMSNTHDCKYYKVEFVADKAKLMAMVEVSPEYPRRPSRFLFQPKEDPTGNKIYDNQLKDIEIEVNAFHDELTPGNSQNWVLSHQIRKVQVCFDIINTSGPQAAVFGRNRRGKDRKRAIVVSADSNQCNHR